MAYETKVLLIAIAQLIKRTNGDEATKKDIYELIDKLGTNCVGYSESH